MFTPSFQNIIGANSIVFLDGGARDNLPPEWALIESKGYLKTIGFEPDVEECDRLNSLGVKSRVYYSKALWNANGKIGIHIAHSPGSSSVYPANQELLAKFDKAVWEPRCPSQYVSVESTTIDSVLQSAESDCDFVKLDVHSAEYEALQGAVTSLKTKIFGVLVETWTLEYHKRQHLAHDVMSLLIDLNFNLFEVGIAAGGRRRITGRVSLYGKQQVHGLDLLFFKEPAVFPSDRDGLVKCVKSAAIADLYGYPDYAIEILNSHIERCAEHTQILQSAIAEIVRSSQVPPQGGFASLH
ncbi:MAG: FkbM family methyltransferase [Cyanobacteria bacterium SID2]|nr:FkbM family methyltransferase [Cyanobacteria bacterium SID2]